MELNSQIKHFLHGSIRKRLDYKQKRKYVFAIMQVQEYATRLP